MISYDAHLTEQYVGLDVVTHCELTGTSLAGTRGNPLLALAGTEVR